MESEKPIELEEIRFNERYANLFQSVYDISDTSEPSVPKIKKKTIFTEDYLRRLHTTTQLSIIPPNCRYIEEMQKGYLVVIEEPPALRTISVDMSMNGEVERLTHSGKLEMYGYKDFQRKEPRPYKFTLAFPYVIFILYVSKYFEVQDGQAYLRTQQMSGLSDYLLKIPATNISDNGHVCFGDKINGRHKSLNAAIQHAIMVWWSAHFNTDYTYNYSDYIKREIPIVSNYLEWQYMSQVNPMFIYDADWIKMDYNILQRLEETKRYIGASGKRAMGYRELAQVFYSTQETGIRKKAFKKSRKTYELFYDIAQGTYLDDKTSINVGDSFTTKNGKVAYIDTFAGFSDGSEVKYCIVDLDGQKLTMKMHRKCKQFLKDKIIDQRRVDQVTLANGETIKPNDIVEAKFNGRTAFYRVDYIRKSRGLEDTYELKMGSDYFLSNNLDAKIFDIGEPEISGIKLNKEDQYLVVRDPLHTGALSTGYRMKFDYIDVSSRGSLIVRFKHANPNLSGSTRSVDLSRSDRVPNIYKIDDVKRLNNVFRVGRKVYYVAYEKDAPQPEGACAINGVIYKEGNFNLSNAKAPYIMKQMIDGNKFHIEGADFNIDFEIGDKVVCANWDNPLDVLTVKMIQGFKVTEHEHSQLSFILADRDGKLSEQIYVDGKKGGVIHTGKIRKVTNKIGRLSAGTKIKANVAGIPCFPKKDTNIIVAFVIDTGTEPLVLCSNGCTLWLNDVLENFTKITMKSKRWPKLQHAPLDLTKIKFQAGDVVNGTRDYKSHCGYLLFGPSSTRALRAMPLEYFQSSPESYCMDRYMVRECRLDCIPAPRISPSKYEEIGTLKGIFNFHSFDVSEHRMDATYLNQRRS